MTDLADTSQDLLTELATLRARVAELEQTTQQHAELKDELRRRDQQFKILVDNAPDIIRRVDKNLRYVYISPAVEQVTGFKPEAFIGKKPTEVGMPEETGLLWERSIRQVFETGQPYSFENVYPTPRGPRHYHTAMVPEYNPDGTIDYAMGVTRDITESKLAEVEREHLLQRLEVERGLLEAVVQQMPAGVIIAAAPDSKMLLANERIKEIWRQPFTSNTETAGYQGFHPDGRRYNLDEWPLARSINRGEQVVEEEIHILRGDGTCGTISVSATPVRDHDGTIVAGVVTVYDISERRQMERDQKFLADASRELFASLDYRATLKTIVGMAVPQIADICMLDMLGEDGLFHSLAVAHLDKSREQELAEQRAAFIPTTAHPNPITLTAGSGRARLIAEISDALLQLNAADDQQLLQFLRSLQLKSAMYLPLTVQGKVVGVLTLLSTLSSGRVFGQRDLTLAEELARRAAIAIDNALLYEEARNAIKARDEFLLVAAHELKTPITSLRGFAQLTISQLDRSGTLNPERLRRSLMLINDQSTKLSRLIAQLLDISRLDAKKLILERKPVELTALLEGVIAAVQSTSSQHSITLKPATAVTVWLDELRIEQVLVNLIENAVKYSPNGGAVEVAVAPLGDDKVQITVTDNGIGIAPEHRPHIFDRFYQGHGTTYLGGMGLGLYISRSIVEMHGGEIYVEFPSDGGTTFVVNLPRRV